jgi:hypothetical protein
MNNGWVISMDSATNHKAAAENRAGASGRVGSDNAQFIERVRSLSSAELVSYLVSAGINTKDGKLTKNYRE